MLRLGIALFVVAAVVFSCGRLAVKRKDDGKKSAPTETGGDEGAPGDVTTDACAREPIDGAACGDALSGSLSDARLQLETVSTTLGPESQSFVPHAAIEDAVSFLDDVVRLGTFKAPTARKGSQAGISWSIAASDHWHVATGDYSFVREPGRGIRVSTATARFVVEAFTSEGWTAESLVVTDPCHSSLVRATKAMAVWQGKVMVATCDGAVYTDYVGDNASTTGSAYKLALADDPKTAATPAQGTNPFCSKPGGTPKHGGACASTVAAILVGAYGDPALWVSPKELRDLKTQVEPVP